MPVGTDRISVLYVWHKWPSALTDCLKRNGETVVNLSSDAEVRDSCMQPPKVAPPCCAGGISVETIQVSPR